MPFDLAESSASLSSRALQSVTSFLGGDLSDNHKAALGDIATTIQSMADNTAQPRIFVSSCDVGQGKSQTLVHTLRIMLADPAYDEVGVLICVGKCDEATALAADLMAPTGKLAIFTSKPAVNAMGTTGHDATTLEQRPDIDTAQVLIVTQQRVERLVGNGKLSECEALHYRGKPRTVKVWEEAWLPGASAILKASDFSVLNKLAEELHKRSLQSALDALREVVEHAEDNAVVEVPDCEELTGWDFSRAISVAKVQLGKIGEAAMTALYVMSGRAARVRRDGTYGNAALNYRNTLPSDLAPMLVLDASARVRETYRAMQAHRDVVMLRTAPRRYDNLTVHHWNKGGGKTSWENPASREALLAGILSTIQSRSTEEWLVVAHKRGKGVPDLEKVLTESLPADVAGRVRVITWGKHQASNSYRNIGNVILAGTVFLRPSVIATTAYIAQGKPVDSHVVDGEVMARTALGEYKHAILQAVGRGRVRQPRAECLPMHAYLIADTRSGIPETLREVFPGCRVKHWRPIGTTLGKVSRVHEAIEKLDEMTGETMAMGIPAEFPEARIRDALKLTRGNWALRVTNHPDWAEALAERGIERIAGVGRTPTVLRLVGQPIDRLEAEALDDIKRLLGLP